MNDIINKEGLLATILQRRQDLKSKLKQEYQSSKIIFLRLQMYDQIFSIRFGEFTC